MTGAHRSAIRGCAAVAALAALWGVQAQPDSGHDLGRHARAATDEAGARAWRLFAELNRPPVDADNAPVPGPAPTTWESWANARAIFRSDGADPGPWPLADAPEQAALRFDGVVSARGTPLRHIVNGVMVPLADPVAASARLAEIRMNRASFEYIRAQRLYVVDGQIAAGRHGNPISFPAASCHVKALWRPIGKTERERYLSREFVFADGSRLLYGLEAMHIASKELPNWFWSTFEHADSAESPPAGIEHADPRWSHYRLRGTMTEFVDATGQPLTLANERLESGLQPGTSSCMTCHARASIGTGAGPVRRLPVFDDDAQTPTAGAVRHATGARRGFIGTPLPHWYVDGGERFATMDFVWTLERAAQP